MIVVPVTQGTPEWIAARLGIPTASQFVRIVTPTGRPSAQADAYMAALIAERIIGVPCVADPDSPWMERGTALEDEARRWYEFSRGVDVQRVGLLKTDDGRVGCSPDALVGEDGLLEIKCPSAATHVGYLMEGGVDRYRAQVQGQAWVSGRRWVDLLSYCPEMPAPLNAVVQRFERDAEYQGALGKALAGFCERLEREYERLTGETAAAAVGA